MIKKEKPQCQDVQDWISIKFVKDNSIYLKDGNIVNLLEVKPINFKLRSLSQQNLILENYKRFFKRCNFDIQVIVQTQKADATKHIKEVMKNIESEKYLSDMASDYIELVKNISSAKRSVSRRFFIAIKKDDNIIENTLKIREGLLACGNVVEECNEKTTKMVIKMYLNKRIANYFN